MDKYQAFNDLVSAVIVFNIPVREKFKGDLVVRDEEIESYVYGTIFYHEIDGVICKLQYNGMNSGKYIYILMENVIING